MSPLSNTQRKRISFEIEVWNVNQVLDQEPSSKELHTVNSAELSLSQIPKSHLQFQNQNVFCASNTDSSFPRRNNRKIQPNSNLPNAQFNLVLLSSWAELEANAQELWFQLFKCFFTSSTLYCSSYTCAYTSVSHWFYPPTNKTCKTSFTRRTKEAKTFTFSRIL